MIPSGDFYDPADNSGLVQPGSALRTESWQYGPIAVSDPSQGLLARLWQAYAVDSEVWLTSTGIAPFKAYTHTHTITSVSLAFDQNGAIVLAFMDTEGASYYYWFDSLTPGYVTTLLDGFSPQVTLDDARPFNVQNSDVILGYTRGGKLRYRMQRDRFDTEYSPLSLETGEEIPALVLYHISMNAQLKLAFLYGNTLTSSAFDSFRFTAPLIMKQQIVKQKAPAEELPITFDFGHSLAFGDYITSAAATMVVESGTDASPENMLSGDVTFTDTAATQVVVGGTAGNVYRLAISVGTNDSCVYVTEGVIYVNNSPAIAPTSE